MFTINIDEKLNHFIKNHPYNGWYIDINGTYCGIINNYLFIIFVSSCTKELELIISKNSSYDCDPLEWVTLEGMTDEAINLAIKHFYIKYS